MGIFIHLSISKSVTKSEWQKVYEETLKLVNVFPLAERRKVKCRGIDTICLVPTVEREETYGWNDPRCNRTYDLWGAKNQGEPYHIYLLAIACLLESRLKEKAFVYGDITRGQCKEAVK